MTQLQCLQNNSQKLTEGSDLLQHFPGHTELVELLLSHKADPKAVNRKGESCIDVASTDEIR